MLVIRIWNYFRGYVIIKIEGLTLEKFINLSIAKGIYLWDIVRKDYTTIEAKVGIKGFKALKEIVNKVGCKISIVEKKGYPFFIHKFKYRKMLGIGSLISILLIFFLTSFIWHIDVEGNENVNEEAIIKSLESIEVKTWMSKRNIDTDEIRKHLLSNMDILSYAHAEINGTKLLVSIKERDVVSEKVPEESPCNIVASKKAVIYKVVAKNGKSVVEQGDIVKEGQILITGIVEDERMEEPLLLHAEGTVMGITWYNEVIEEPIIKTIKEETGRVHTTKEVKIGNKRLHLMNGDIPFKDYIETTSSDKIIKIGEVDFPFDIIKHTYKEVEVKEVKQNVDSLKTMMSVTGVQNVMERIPKGAQVITKDIKHSIIDNTLVTNISIEVREEIGIKKQIN